MTSALSRPVLLLDRDGSGRGGRSRERSIEPESQATLGGDRSLQPALGQGEIDVFILVESEEPVPHVPERDPGRLGDPDVLDERLGIALSILNRLENHPLNTGDTSHDHSLDFPSQPSQVKCAPPEPRSLNVDNLLPKPATSNV